MYLRREIGKMEEKLLALEKEINVMNDMDSGDEELEQRWCSTNEGYDGLQNTIHRYNSALSDVQFKTMQERKNQQKQQL